MFDPSRLWRRSRTRRGAAADGLHCSDLRAAGDDELDAAGDGTADTRAERDTVALANAFADAGSERCTELET